MIDEISVRTCAELVIATVPMVMSAFRRKMREHRPAELSVPQFRTLIHLRCRPGASISEIADFLGLALSTTSQLVDGLFKRGYVTREVAAGDRRRAIVSLTEQGRTMLEAVHDKAQAQMEERLSALTPEERQAVLVAMAAFARLFRNTSVLSEVGDTGTDIHRSHS